MHDIPDLSLCHRLHTLTLRSNFITTVDSLHSLPALTDLDLYENRITDLNKCNFPPSLTSAAAQYRAAARPRHQSEISPHRWCVLAGVSASARWT
jgi:hypothetical protein